MTLRLLNAHPGLDLTEVWARATYFCFLHGLNPTQSAVWARATHFCFFEQLLNHGVGLTEVWAMQSILNYNFFGIKQLSMMFCIRNDNISTLNFGILRRLDGTRTEMFLLH